MGNVEMQFMIFRFRCSKLKVRRKKMNAVMGTITELIFAKSNRERRYVNARRMEEIKTKAISI